MKLHVTSTTRVMRLMPALLQMVWGPALCMGMPNIHARPRPGIGTAMPTRDPISAVYAGILNPLRPAGTLSREQSSSATSDIAAELKADVLAHKHTVTLPSAAEIPVQNPKRGLAFCRWSTHRDSGLSSVFNTLYTVNRSSGTGGRRIPKLMPTYWRSMTLPSMRNVASARTNFTSRSQDTARLAGPFGRIPIADLVKANFFRMVSLAQNSW